MKRLLICVFLLSILFAAACKNPAGKSETKATVISVTINPEVTSIEKGAEKEFSAEVEVTGKAAKTVTWTVSGTSNAGTVINPIAESNKAVLTVAADENAANITIKATSTVDSTKFKTLTLTVTESGTPPVITVSVLPETAAVDKGGTQEFTANVTVPEGGDEGVTWTVTGNLSQDTIIDPIGETNKAILSVAIDETSESLTVTAASKEDSTVTGSALVTVQSLDNIWLVGIPDWTFPTGTAMTQSGDTFVWQGDVDTDSTFRFSLTDTTTGWGDIWNGNWFAPAADNTEVTLDNAENDMTRFNTNTAEGAVSATDNAWKISNAGYYILTVKPVEMKLRVERPVIVETVTVNGINSIKIGTSSPAGGITATVTGINSPAQTVTWSIDGEQGTDYAAGTSINSAGILTVAAGETAASLIIRATSTENTEKSGAKTIAVTDKDTLPDAASINLSALGIATWTYSDATNVNNYELQLYEDTSVSGNPVYSAVGSPVSSGLTLNYDFLGDMRGAGPGKYAFTVTAKSNNTALYLDSFESVKSNIQTVTSRTQVPFVWWDSENGKALWTNPDLDGDYVIQIYKDSGSKTTVGGERPATINTTQPSSRPGASGIETMSDFHLAFAGVPAENGALYSFTVTALGDDALVLDATPSDESDQRNYTITGDARVWTIVEGGSRFIAGADNGRIAWSNDGITWTLAGQDVFRELSPYKEYAIRGIAHDGTAGLGRFVAVGYNGKAAYSDDGGETWTGVDSTFGNTSILSIAYGNGIFLAGGDGGNVRQSSNGISWSNIDGWNGGITILDDAAVISLMFDDNTSSFIAFSPIGQHCWSASGTNNWEYIANNIDEFSGDKNQMGTRNVLNGTAGNGTVVIVSGGETWLPYSSNLTTGASSSWSWSEHFADAGIQSVAFGYGKFIAVGEDGKASASSDSSATWTAIANTGFTGGEAITAACVKANGDVILAGYGKITVATP